MTRDDPSREREGFWEYFARNAEQIERSMMLVTFFLELLAVILVNQAAR